MPYTPDAERNPPATPTTRDKTALAADLRERAADYLRDAKEMAFVGLRHPIAAAKAIVYRDASELLTSRAKRVLGSVYDGEAAEVYAETLRELDAGLKQAAPHFATTTTKTGTAERVSIEGHVTAERRVSGKPILPADRNGMPPCGKCYGKGRREHWNGVYTEDLGQCPDCQGLGAMPIPPPPTCSGAPGTGEQPHGEVEKGKRVPGAVAASQSASVKRDAARKVLAFRWAMEPGRIGELVAHHVTRKYDEPFGIEVACGKRLQLFEYHDSLNAIGLDDLQARVPASSVVTECPACAGTGWVAR